MNLTEIIEKARAEHEEQQERSMLLDVAEAERSFRKYFPGIKATFAWEDHLGRPVAETDDMKIAYSNDDDYWGIVATCQECGKEYCIHFCHPPLLHEQPPHVCYAGLEQTCPIDEEVFCRRQICAWWYAKSGMCSLTSICDTLDVIARRP